MFTSKEVCATEFLDLAFGFAWMGLQTGCVLVYRNVDSLQHRHCM